MLLHLCQVPSPSLFSNVLATLTVKESSRFVPTILQSHEGEDWEFTIPLQPFFLPPSFLKGISKREKEKTKKDFVKEVEKYAFK